MHYEDAEVFLYCLATEAAKDSPDDLHAVRSQAEMAWAALGVTNIVQ